jgi:hypothetical protein
MTATSTPVATANSARSFLGMISPLIPIILGIGVLAAKGYRPFDYFELIAAGDLSPLRQSLGWLGVIMFIPVAHRAYRIRRNRGVLAWSDGDRLSFLLSTERIRIADLEDVKVEQGYWSKQLRLTLSDGRVVAVSAPYVEDNSDTLRKQLLGLRPAVDAVHART